MKTSNLQQIKIIQANLDLLVTINNIFVFAGTYNFKKDKNKNELCLFAVF